MFALCNPNIAGLLQGEQPEIWAQSGPRLRWFERRRQSIAISPKLLEQETSNLVHSFIWGMPIGHTNNFPKSGRALGHVTATIFDLRQGSKWTRSVVIDYLILCCVCKRKIKDTPLFFSTLAHFQIHRENTLSVKQRQGRPTHSTPHGTPGLREWTEKWD